MKTLLSISSMNKFATIGGKGNSWLPQALRPKVEYERN
jgi:hypothetical protein